jgi:transitional endoplasmic reticulum ATPase
MKARQKLAFRRAEKQRPKSGKTASASPYDELQRCWMYRLVCGMRRFQVFLCGESGESVEVRHFLRIGPLEGQLARKNVVDRARALSRRLGCQRVEPRSPLGHNVARLAELAVLDEVETEILVFVVVLALEQPLKSLLSDIDTCTRERAQELLAIALGVGIERIKKATGANGILAQSELLKLEAESQNALCKFRLMEGLAERLAEDHAADVDLFRHFFAESAETHLEERAFPHLREDFALVTNYLRIVLDTHQRGVNVLLHGIPGAGKTEFARLIAKAVGADLYQVAASESGSPGMERLGAYTLCQRFLKHRDQCLVLFDEVEDVFPVAWEHDAKRTGKARINALLESNLVPAIWISNSVVHIDEAYLRRFDYSIVFPPLPREVRHEVLAAIVEGRSDAVRLLKIFEEQEAITPSLAITAIKLVDAGEAHGMDGEAIARRAVDQWNAVSGRHTAARKIGFVS